MSDRWPRARTPSEMAARSPGYRADDERMDRLVRGLPAFESNRRVRVASSVEARSTHRQAEHSTGNQGRRGHRDPEEAQDPARDVRPRPARPGHPAAPGRQQDGQHGQAHRLVAERSRPGERPKSPRATAARSKTQTTRPPAIQSSSPSPTSRGFASMEHDRPDHGQATGHRVDARQQLGGRPGEPPSSDRIPRPPAEGRSQQDRVDQRTGGGRRRRGLRRHSFGGHRGSIPDRRCGSREDWRPRDLSGRSAHFGHRPNRIATMSDFGPSGRAGPARKTNPTILRPGESPPTSIDRGSSRRGSHDASPSGQVIRDRSRWPGFTTSESRTSIF